MSNEAEEYMKELEDVGSVPSGDFVYRNVEVTDPIAGVMANDPRIEIVSAEKGVFGLDSGTMVLDIKLRCNGDEETDD